MRQAETKDRQEEKALKRQILVHSSQWTLQPKDKFGTVEVSAPTAESESVGFSDILEVEAGNSLTTNGRRGFGKFAKKVSEVFAIWFLVLGSNWRRRRIVRAQAGAKTKAAIMKTTRKAQHPSERSQRQMIVIQRILRIRPAMIRRIITFCAP